MKRLMYPVAIFSLAFVFLAGCQKEDDTTLKPDARLCPEVNMQNYDEVELIISDYLKSQQDSSSERNLTNLESWLKSSDCIRQISLTKGLYDSFPPQRAMHIDFSGKHLATGADLYLYIHDDGHLSISSFFYQR